MAFPVATSLDVLARLRDDARRERVAPNRREYPHFFGRLQVHKARRIWALTSSHSPFSPNDFRHDFLLQMYRYMEIAYGENGLAQYGKRMDVELISNGKEGDEELTNGMLVVIYGNKDGEEVEICELICEMDDEQVPIFDTLMPSQDGELVKTNRSGKDEFVTGKYFVIKRPVPIDETANPALKQMIKDMTLAINKYYAFGSCFSDDN